jgi:hypothetical protein
MPRETSGLAVSGSYVSDDLRDRTDDIVWRARWGEGWIYVYLLIEFQSAIEPYMAVRILTYVGLLYQDLIKSRQLPDDGRLPPVLPIVLYRGSARWSASLDIVGLLQPGPRALDIYRPDRSGTLRQQRACLAAQLGRCLVPAGERPHARGDRWCSAHADRVAAKSAAGQPAPCVQEWGEEFQRKGLQEGRREGLREGEARFLLRLLASRFGDLPQGVQERVQQADLSQLERWGERLLDARTLADLFE